MLQTADGLRTISVAFIFIWICTLHCSYGEQPLVRLTDNSPLLGRYTRGKNGKEVTEFLGIPFAEPPVRDLRFKPPVTKRPWTKVHNATKLPNSCLQTLDVYFENNFTGAYMWNANTERNEDCLYLNVWVPGRLDPTKRLTVMVWIFGGGFWSGTSTLDVYDGKILASEEQVIVVSMNYRVSVFGFLYLDRPEAPGNMGLLDQLESLKWVREHIQHFGGNPNSVTLFGESAGAASVSMHVLSPLSQPYFNRAILESGSVLAPWAMESGDTMIGRALQYGVNLSCNITKDDPPPYDKLLRCLQEANTSHLLQNEWVTAEFNDFPWTPVVDRRFLVEEPRAALRRGNFKRSNILLGSNYDESIYFIVYFAPSFFPKDDLFSTTKFLEKEAQFEGVARQLLPTEFDKNPAVREAIFMEYRDFDTYPMTSERRIDRLDKMMGDYHFTCSVNEFAKSYLDNNLQVYYYYFTHRSSMQTWPPWMGVLHAYEINYVFGEPLNTVNYNYTEKEKDLSRRFMHYFANFARTGCCCAAPGVRCCIP